MTTKTLVFLAGSSSQRDIHLRDKLIQQLKPLEQQNAIFWHRDNIKPGSSKKTEIKGQIDNADITLLLISPDFVNDPQCREEVALVMKRHEAGKTRAVPIILRPVNWENEPYCDLSPLPADGIPVASSDNIDYRVEKAFYDIAGSIKKLIQEVQTKKEEHSLPPTPESDTPDSGQETNSAAQGPTESISPHFNGTKPQGRPQRDNSPLSPVSSSPERWKYWAIAGSFVFVLLSAVIIMAPILNPMAIDHRPTPVQEPTPTPVLPVLPSDLSEGRTIFDVNRADGQLKQKAAQKLQKSDLVHAQALLRFGVEEDSSDAEALIYLKNIQVRLSGLPYITLVASVSLPEDNTSSIPGGDRSLINRARDMLQGIYIAQQEYNDQAIHAKHVLVRVLIANVSDTDSIMQSQELAQEIANLAPQEKIVGVVGRPLSVEGGARNLEDAQIPVVSSQATCDAPAGVTNFFSVSPSLQDEVTAAINYSRPASHIGLYFDYSDSYSYCLSNELSRQLHADGITPVPVYYPTGHIDTYVTEVQQQHFDFIYFTGNPTDASTLLNGLRAIHYQVPVLGGDILYQYVHFPANQMNNFNGMIFTAFGYHGQWNEVRCASARQDQQLSFFCEYEKAFNPALYHQAPIHYGSTFADSDAVLGCDAVNLLLQASGTLLTAKTSSFKSAQFLLALKAFTQHQRFMAVSGSITFGPDGYPINAPILILSVKSTGTYLEKTYQ